MKRPRVSIYLYTHIVGRFSCPCKLYLLEGILHHKLVCLWLSLSLPDIHHDLLLQPPLLLHRGSMVWWGATRYSSTMLTKMSPLALWSSCRGPPPRDSMGTEPTTAGPLTVRAASGRRGEGERGGQFGQGEGRQARRARARGGPSLLVLGLPPCLGATQPSRSHPSAEERGPCTFVFSALSVGEGWLTPI